MSTPIDSQPSKDDDAVAASEVSTAVTASTALGPPDSDFTVEIIKSFPDEGTGLHVGGKGDSLVVNKLKEEGAVPNFNKTAAHEKIKAGDRIVAVNGIYGSKTKMIAELKKPSFMVSVKRDDESVKKEETKPIKRDDTRRKREEINPSVSKDIIPEVIVPLDDVSPEQGGCPGCLRHFCM